MWKDVAFHDTVKFGSLSEYADGAPVQELCTSCRPPRHEMQMLVLFD